MSPGCAFAVVNDDGVRRPRHDARVALTRREERFSGVPRLALFLSRRAPASIRPCCGSSCADRGTCCTRSRRCSRSCSGTTAAPSRTRRSAAWAARPSLGGMGRSSPRGAAADATSAPTSGRCDSSETSSATYAPTKTNAISRSVRRFCRTSTRSIAPAARRATRAPRDRASATGRAATRRSASGRGEPHGA